MHSAKGLEFPLVFLHGGYRGKTSRKSGRGTSIRPIREPWWWTGSGGNPPSEGIWPTNGRKTSAYGTWRLPGLRNDSGFPCSTTAPLPRPNPFSIRPFWSPDPRTPGPAPHEPILPPHQLLTPERRRGNQRRHQGPPNGLAVSRSGTVRRAEGPVELLPPPAARSPAQGNLYPRRRAAGCPSGIRSPAATHPW